MPKTPPNPVRRYKDRHELTYPELARVLAIGEDYAKRLGANIITSVSPAMAKQFEKRTKGEISFLAMMRWVEAHLDAA